MNRNRIVSVLLGLLGSAVLLVLLSMTSVVGAQGAAVPSDVSRVNAVTATTPLTSTFTYQGQLKNGGNAVNGSCQMAFRLYDAATGGGLIGSPITTSVPVANGLFHVGLDFGSSAFDASGRWLDMRVACGGGFTQLTPRQALTAVPYALAFGAPGSVSGYMISGTTPGPYPTIGFNTYGTYPYYASAAGYGGVLQFQNGSGALWYATGTNAAAGAEHVFTPRLAIDANGNVGIGTTAPTSKLEIAAQDGLAVTGYQPYITLRDANAGNKRGIIQSVSGDMALFSNSFIGGNPPLVIKDGSGNVGIGTLNPLEKLDVNGNMNVNGDIQGTSFSAPAGLFLNAWTGRIALRVADGGQIPAERLTILANGNVGIGTTTPATTLVVEGVAAVGGTFYVGGIAQVKGPDTSGSTVAFSVLNSSGFPLMKVYDGAGVSITPSGARTTEHICFLSSSWLITQCSSAAEYVPTIDSGFGFPETADLVSIVPNVTNPYGDEHAPFVVVKSAQACDSNLLGFIVNPQSGADGKKLNDHYLPLAIYGYFPAKVTLENGAIKRGDALTSSSKPGYAMKATQACKIIGYALEDADHEGTIQVFANHGETAMAEVATLHTQVKELQDQNAALDARLTALEQKMSGPTK